ncbi:MAG: alpha/beta fold hydrolase [Spirochaetales bacterium]|nr:alpha/beta fold hydrolase [Spirochaetales bacterium]
MDNLYRPKRLAALGFLFLVTVIAAQAREHILVAVELVETLSPGAVDEEVGELFEGVEAPRSRFQIDCYLIRYESRYPDGQPAQITAQLFLPRVPDGDIRAAYIFAPGTTGLLDACRPSREHIAGIRWGLYRAHVLAFAGQGIVGVLPDYMGFGDAERLQPIYNAVAEGRMMLDGARALYRFLELRQKEEAGRATRRSPQPPVFVAGFSQGGHAAFAAADLRRLYARDVRLAGVIGYGPTTDLEALLREFPVVAPMAVYSFSQSYGAERFDPAKILQQRWVETLAEDVSRQCVGGMQSYYPWSPRELFRPEFAEALSSGRLAEAYPDIHRILSRHSTGLAGHRIPALILQGGDDVVVSARSQERFVGELCRRGSPVLYLHFPNSRHDTRQVGFIDTLKWMEQLVAGAPAPANCQAFASGASGRPAVARLGLDRPAVDEE